MNVACMIYYIIVCTDQKTRPFCALETFNAIIIKHLMQLFRLPNLVNKIVHKGDVDYISMRSLMYFLFYEGLFN